MKARMLVLSFVMTAAAVAAYVAPEPLLTPADGSPIPVAGGSGNVAIADLNRDTKPDLVVLSGMSRRVTILLGDGRGRFERPTNGLAVPESPNEIAMGDIDADGSVDLALASHDSHNVTLLLGDGRGGFRPSPRSPIVMRDGPRPHTHGLAVAEVNQDGRLDLATVNSDDNNDVSIALNDGQGRFTRTPGSPFAVAPSPYPMAQGDLDGDGDVDLVVSSTGLSLPAAAAAANRRLTMLLGDGRGSFERRDIPLRTSGSWFVATGDINGDGTPDLAVTHAGRDAGRLTVLLGDGRGAFTEVDRSPFNLGQSAWHMSLVDLNGDRMTDVAAAANAGVSVLLGDGRGGFTPAPGSPFATAKGSWRLSVADLNGDRKPDVVAGSAESDSVTVLLGH